MGLFSKNSSNGTGNPTAKQQERMRRQTEAQSAVRRTRAQAGRDYTAKQGKGK